MTTTQGYCSGRPRAAISLHSSTPTATPSRDHPGPGAGSEIDRPSLARRRLDPHAAEGHLLRVVVLRTGNVLRFGTSTLEAPYRGRHDSVETKDLILDIVVTPQRASDWKDTDEFDLRVGHPLYFDPTRGRRDPSRRRTAHHADRGGRLPVRRHLHQVPPGFRLASDAAQRRRCMTGQPSRYSQPLACHSKLAATNSRTLRPLATCSNARYVARCPISMTRRPAHRDGRSARNLATRAIA
jgi:hypothetical protein